MLMFDSEKRFFKGNLHMHTTNSDGRRAPQEALEIYRANGYDFVALTDHWKRAPETAEMLDGMLILPGIELDYTLPGQVVHIVGVGVDASVENAERHRGVQNGLDMIRKAGGRAILAHPAWSLNTPEVIGALRGITAAEVYNAVSGTPWNGDRADSTGVLDVAAANGHILNTVASDDSHFYEGEECSSWIMLQADELSQEGILRALDEGTFYSTRGPRFEQIEVTDDEIRVKCSPVSRVVFHSNLFYTADRVTQGEALVEASYRIKRANGEQFVRAVLIDDEGRRAWSNPIRIQ